MKFVSICNNILSVDLGLEKLMTHTVASHSNCFNFLTDLTVINSFHNIFKTELHKNVSYLFPQECLYH